VNAITTLPGVTVKAKEDHLIKPGEFLQSVAYTAAEVRLDVLVLSTICLRNTCGTEPFTERWGLGNFSKYFTTRFQFRNNSNINQNGKRFYLSSKTTLTSRLSS